MITNQVPGQITKIWIDQNPPLPDNLVFGQGTTESTREDTDAESEYIRFSTNGGGSTAGVSWIQGEVNSLTATATFSEVATFDNPTTGILYDRELIPIYVTHDSNHNTRITRFVSVNPKNTNKKIITDTGLEKISKWISGTTFTEPTHIGWGTIKILDKCDSLGGAPNNWTTSTDGTVGLNISNFVEGTASINLGKSGQTTATVYFERTLSSAIDVSNGDNLIVRFNPNTSEDYNKLTSTGSIIIWFGEDSSNYREARFNKGNVSVGWQRLGTSVVSMNTIGSPDLANTDYLRITLNFDSSTATATLGNFIMDWWGIDKDLEFNDSGLYDEQTRIGTTTKLAVGNKATFKQIMSTDEGNDYNYNTSGLFNSSSNGDMFFENKFIEVPKGSKSKIISEVSVITNIKDE